MVSATWNEPLTGGVTGGGPLVRWFGLLVRWLRGALSVREASEFEAATTRIRGIAAPVLEATSREDLVDRLDAAWSESELGQLVQETMPTMSADAFASVAIPAETLDAMKPVLGEGPVAIIAHTAPLIAVCGGVLARLIANHEVTLTQLPTTNLYDLLASPGIHSTLKRCVLGSFRASIALATISHAVFRGHRLEPWLALALAENYHDELYLFARLNASVSTDVEVPESVVPHHDRFDLDHLQAEVEANEFLWNGVAELAGHELSLCEVPDAD